jgi:HSP20 family protein
MAVLVRRRDLSAPPVHRWQPFPEIEQLQEQMGQLMERVMSTDETGAWVPLVDIEETEDAWIVEAEVPGVRNEDVDVEVRDSEIAITGEIKERERQGILRRKTRRVGRFEFRVALPGQTDPEKVEAALDNGVLTVRIPKPEMTRPRHIEVRSGNGDHPEPPASSEPPQQPDQPGQSGQSGQSG